MKHRETPVFAGRRDTDFADPITPALTCGGRSVPHPRRWEARQQEDRQRPSAKQV